jgi:hypothetical protein
MPSNAITCVTFVFGSIYAHLKTRQQPDGYMSVACRVGELGLGGCPARMWPPPCRGVLVMTERGQQPKLIMKSSNVVPTLLLSPVFSSNIVPALLPRRQQVVDVVAEIGGSATTPGQRSCWTTLPTAPPAQGCHKNRASCGTCQSRHRRRRPRALGDGDGWPPPDAQFPPPAHSASGECGSQRTAPRQTWPAASTTR